MNVAEIPDLLRQALDVCPHGGQLARDAEELPETMRDMARRYPDEPYRRRLGAIAERRRRTRSYLTEEGGPISGRYDSPARLLAEIDTPELDEQLRQAKTRVAQAVASARQASAAVVQAQANQKLAQIENQRTLQLVKEGVFAKQQADTTQATYDARAADVDAMKAALHAAEEATRAAESEVARLTVRGTAQVIGHR